MSVGDVVFVCVNSFPARAGQTFVSSLRLEAAGARGRKSSDAPKVGRATVRMAAVGALSPERHFSRDQRSAPR